MNLVHAQCGKKLSPLKMGESYDEYEGTMALVCVICGNYIVKGESVCGRDAGMFAQITNNKDLPPNMKPQLRALALQGKDVTKFSADDLMKEIQKSLPEEGAYYKVPGVEISLADDFKEGMDLEKANEDALRRMAAMSGVPLPPPPNVVIQPKPDHNELARILLPQLLEQLSNGVVPDMVRQIVGTPNVPLKIQINDMPEKDVGLQHRRFPLLLRALLAGTNVWLAGPSGSGKTTAAKSAARALDTSFRYTGAVDNPYGLMGFRSATGEYVRTPFREAWEHGGLFLWDEVDGSDPNALLAFNAALGNQTCAFPDAIIDKHPKCLIVAAGNTWGHGATNEYVGRTKLDAAFLKRFAFIGWDYDEDLERATATNKEWCARVQEVRKRVKAKGLRVLVTPRETYIGERLLAAGCTKEEAEEMTIRSGMTNDQWSQVSGSPLSPGGSPTGRRPGGSGGSGPDWKYGGRG